MPLGLQEWAALGEIFAAVAVVITLVYLARQVRQGSSNIHNSTSWAITQPIGSFQPKCMLRLSALCTAPRDVASPQRN